MNNDPESPTKPDKIHVLTKRVGNAPHDTHITSPSRFSFVNSFEPKVQSNDNVSLQSLTQPHRSHSSFIINSSLTGSRDGILGPSSDPKKRYDRQKSLFSTERGPTTSETRKHIISYLLITLIAIGLIYGIIAFAFMAKKDDDGLFCDTDFCKVKSAALLSSLNTSVDPCEDFYEFSCGSKLSSKDSLSTFELVTTRIFELKKTLLESPYPMDDLQSPLDRDRDQSVFNKVQTYYRACLVNFTYNCLTKCNRMKHKLNQWTWNHSLVVYLN